MYVYMYVSVSGYVAWVIESVVMYLGNYVESVAAIVMPPNHVPFFLRSCVCGAHCDDHDTAAYGGGDGDGAAVPRTVM